MKNHQKSYVEWRKIMTNKDLLPEMYITESESNKNM